jgi:Cd2+/Zn2+-exporting ATPase
METETTKMELRIHGLDCVEEVALLKRELMPLVGEDKLGFDVLNGKLVVDLSSTGVQRDQIMSAIEQTGLKAEPWQSEADAIQQLSFWSQHQRTILTAVSGVFGALGLITQIATSGLGETGGDQISIVAIGLYCVAILAGLYLVLPKAWRSAVTLRPDMNLLMSVAVVGAVLIGEWFEGATVAFLFSLSLLLESWSISRARRAVAALMDLAPPSARIRDESGKSKEVAPSEVSVGTIFIVRPGEKIPLDGTVVKGASAVNQAPITGESSPVDKETGSEVFAGTINGDGVIEVESIKPATDTTLAKIIRMVGDAQSQRSPSEQWVEKFARYYTPAVMVLALLILFVPPLLFGGVWAAWLYRALVLLVIACPCALVISTPVSIVAALAAAAKNGVLIKGGLYVETPAKLRAIAVDKTGTLTHGTPKVINVVPLNGHDEAELIERAAALESHSNHPLALAIVRYADEQKFSIPDADDFEIIQGKGARGSVNGKPYWLGSHKYLEERGQETPEVHEQLEALQDSGRSIVVVGNDQHVCGFISLADTVRQETKGILADLHTEGIEDVAMLTGDNAGTAKAIAAEVGIDSVHAELLPENKVEIMEALVQKYEFVAMVGDGVNDAPALARSSLGIAMGAVGTDAAIETADIALMSDDLSKLPWLIRHSKRTLSIIRQNIWFSLGVKLIFVVLAFAGFATLWAAIAADMGASLLVIFNSLRLLRGK